jgi:hypothetical protein
MVGIIAMAGGCDTSNASPPAAPVDSGSGADSAVVDSGNGGGDTAVADSGNGGGDSTVAEGGNSGNDASTVDGGGEAAVADGGGEAAVADGGGDAKVEDGGGDAKVEDGGDAGSEAGSCLLPACLTNLTTSCVPSGTCSETDDSANATAYQCYASGVKLSNVINLDGDNVVIAKSSTGVCYSFTFTGNDLGNVPTDVPVTNGSDAGVATIHQDIASDGVTQVWSVTCAGGQPIALDPSCESVWPIAWMESGGLPSCTGTATCTW